MPRELLDEALRIGSGVATQASRQTLATRAAVDAIIDALELLRSGRIGHARERLDKVLVTIARITQPDGG